MVVCGIIVPVAATYSAGIVVGLTHAGAIQGPLLLYRQSNGSDI